MSAAKTRQIPIGLKSFFRSRLTTCALFLLSVLVALGVLELGARVFLGESPLVESGQYREHPRRIFTHVSNRAFVHEQQVGENETVTMNVALSSRGLRDKDYGPKQADEYRILMLGDSMTFGHGLSIEQTIPKVLENLLAKEETQKKIAVMNGGTQGYGPWQEADWLDEIGFSLAPDLVILQLFANDFSDSLSKVGKSLNSAEWRSRLLMFRSQRLWHVRAERWLRAHSYAYALSSRANHERPWLIALLEKTPFITAKAEREEVVDIEGRTWWLEASLKDWTPSIEEAWEILKSDVLSIREACKAKGIAFAAYIMPGCATVFENEGWDNEMQGPHAAEYERGKVERIVEGFLAEKGIATFSLLDAFAAYSDGNTVYYERDGHLRPLGAKVVAERIKGFLRNDLHEMQAGNRVEDPDNVDANFEGFPVFNRR